MEGWAMATDDVGRVYYYNARTREVAWQKPADARALRALREAQLEIEERARSHAAARLGTCFRIRRADALQRAMREWKSFLVGPGPTISFVRPMAQALSAWMVQRDRTLAAIAGTMLVQDYADLLKVRVHALESAERAGAEFDRLKRNRRCR